MISFRPMRHLLGDRHSLRDSQVADLSKMAAADVLRCVFVLCLMSAVFGLPEQGVWDITIKEVGLTSWARGVRVRGRGEEGGGPGRTGDVVVGAGHVNQNTEKSLKQSESHRNSL